MGYGDEVMATGLAKVVAKRGKRAAFGDGKQIVFSKWSTEVFKNNPNIIRPGEENAPDVEWVAHYKGHRLYNALSRDRRRWIWNSDFKAVPGEFYFDDMELAHGRSAGKGFIIIEPNLPLKAVKPNKEWGFTKYVKVAFELLAAGYDVAQFTYGRLRLPGVKQIHSKTYREAVAFLSQAALFIGPEGGLHHAAAAVGVPGVVIFGGFIPASLTGYDIHINLTGNSQEACGSLTRCRHCRVALNSISPETVIEASIGVLDEKCKGLTARGRAGLFCENSTRGESEVLFGDRV